MNRDDMIEKAARAIAAERHGAPDAWAVYATAETTRDMYRCTARVALESTGALSPEPLPVGTRKRSPEGDEAILTDEDDSLPWLVYKVGAMIAGNWLTDDKVEDWETITDAPATNDMRVIQDGPDSQDIVPADRILGPTQVAIDLSRDDAGWIKEWANGPHGDPFADAARAELARRGES